jgi:hypothetical protein
MIYGFDSAELKFGFAGLKFDSVDLKIDSVDLKIQPFLFFAKLYRAQHNIKKFGGFKKGCTFASTKLSNINDEYYD